MNRIIIILIVFLLSLPVFGCVKKNQTTFCPTEDASFLDDFGRVMIMKKGFFNDKEGHWLTEDEFREMIEQYKRKRGY